MKHTKLSACTLAAAAVLLGGCNTPAKSADTKDATKTAKEETYVQVNSMGSWIPRKVKKKEDLMGDSTQVATPGALDKTISVGQTHVATDAPGNR